MSAFILILLALVICLLMWWLLIETEGAYLGRRLVIALYDIYAGRYDRVKQFDDENGRDSAFGAAASTNAGRRMDPLILDVATGTGRLPMAMARNARFQGHVIGIDLSRRMLGVAADKVADERFAAYILLARADAMRLPFPDESFDAVACLEALEFLPDPEAALREMERVLRSGGILLTTLRINARWMPGRAWSESKMHSYLLDLDFQEVQVEAWQSDYSKVWAQKAGARSEYRAVGPGKRDAFA